MYAAIDPFLAAVLRGEAGAWPNEWDDLVAADTVQRRILYHGITGLFANRAVRLTDWPRSVIEAARELAVAQAMWELQHQPLLARLLGAFAAAAVEVVVLKGSALAYDLYEVPATRARGDTDLLVAPANRDRARAILSSHGFKPLESGCGSAKFNLQEGWTLQCASGMEHQVDLHWQLLNAHALGGVMPVAECLARPLALPRLGQAAHAMRRGMTLLHSCVHRAMHLTAPYFVGGETYYGGDRLIWAVDIDLLARVLSDEEWRDLAATARRYGVARACLAGLDLAHRWLGTDVPATVRAELAAATDEVASAYLLDCRQSGRARRDLKAISGMRRKLAYLAQRTLPSRAFIRAKYPALARYPVTVGYARRVIDLLRRRRSASER